MLFNPLVHQQVLRFLRFHIPFHFNQDATALMIAIVKKLTPQARVLLEAGADTTTVTYTASTSKKVLDNLQLRLLHHSGI
jgi:hypothetical protein